MAQPGGGGEEEERMREAWKKDNNVNVTGGNKIRYQIVTTDDFFLQMDIIEFFLENICEKWRSL